MHRGKVDLVVSELPWDQIVAPGSCEQALTLRSNCTTLLVQHVLDFSLVKQKHNISPAITIRISYPTALLFVQEVYF